jgi:hypothetical protein
MMAHRLVWLAELPPNSPEIWRKSSEEEYLEPRSPTGSNLFFCYDGAGKALLAAVPKLSRQQILFVYLNQCRIAAQRSRWMSDFVQHGRAVPEEISKSIPKNPFTGYALSASANPCTLPQNPWLMLQAEEWKIRALSPPP